MIHGDGDRPLTPEDKDIFYERVSEENAAELALTWRRATS